MTMSVRSLNPGVLFIVPLFLGSTISSYWRKAI